MMTIDLTSNDAILQSDELDLTLQRLGMLHDLADYEVVEAPMTPVDAFTFGLITLQQLEEMEASE